MKKFLSFIVAAAVLCSCGKDDNGGGGNDGPGSGGGDCPVTGISIPASSADAPFHPGETITIQGKGFTASSQIWLRSAAKAADVKADITGFNAQALTFTAPEVYGKQSVILKQNGSEWSLGKLYFAEQSEEPGPGPSDPDVLPRKVKSLNLVFEDSYGGWEDRTDFYYDPQGRISEYTKPDGQYRTVIDWSENNKVTIKRLDKPEADGITIELAQGRATRYNESGQEVSLKYDASGNISSFSSSPASGSTSEWTAYDGSVKFANGLMKQFDITGTEYDGEDEFGIKSTINIEYGNLDNNLNLDFGSLYIESDEFDIPTADIASLLGLTGNRTKKLPVKTTETVVLSDGTNTLEMKYISSFSYKMSGDYITEISIVTKDDEDYETSMTVTISYYEE